MCIYKKGYTAVKGRLCTLGLGLGLGLWKCVVKYIINVQLQIVKVIKLCKYENIPSYKIF